MADQFDRWLEAELQTSLSQTGADSGPTEPTYKRLQRRAAAGSAARRRIWHRPVTRLGVVVIVSGALLAGGTAAAAVHVFGPALGSQSSSGLTTPPGHASRPRFRQPPAPAMGSRRDAKAQGPRVGWGGPALIRPPAHTARPHPPRRVRHTPQEARPIQGAPGIPPTPLTRRIRRRPPTLAATAAQGLQAIPGRGEGVEAVAARCPPARARSLSRAR